MFLFLVIEEAQTLAGRQKPALEQFRKALKTNFNESLRLIIFSFKTFDFISFPLGKGDQKRTQKNKEKKRQKEMEEKAFSHFWASPFYFR